MKVFASRAVRALALCLALFGTFSCTRDQELVSISVIPNTEVFGAPNIPLSADAGLSLQLRALGTYIHPPVTKDITDSVVWSSNDNQMVTASSTGLITATGFACGSTLVSATVQTNHSNGDRPSTGAIVTGTMTADVICFTGSGSGGGGGGGSSAVLTVLIQTGSGSVVSNPSAINCPAVMCSATFGTPATVTLTSTPDASSGFTHTGWTGCTGFSGNTCTVFLTSNTTVFVTFS